MASKLTEVVPAVSISDWERLQSRCRGIPPIDARWAAWMKSCCLGDLLPRLVEEYGSPLNVHCAAPFARNIKQLYRVAKDAGIRFDVYFARKANKCIAYVQVARQIGCGVDVASLEELRQTFEAGVPAERIVVTAAVKSSELLAECIARGVVVVLDNVDEIERVAALASKKSPANIAIRISGFSHEGEKLRSRFGIDIDQFESTCLPALAPCNSLRVGGLHFHLDGYSAAQRVSALWQTMAAVELARNAGHPIDFIDAGGGMPMSYVDAPTQLHTFWQRLEEALIGTTAPITWNNNGLGQYAVDGVVYGRRETYPHYQEPVQSAWLRSILAAPADGESIAEALGRLDLELRCEPGRAILDGCGFTAARVEFRKQTAEGTWLIGLSMNHTQCRTGSVDFLVDPLLVRTSTASAPTDPIEGYLVGAYCTESEFLTWRRFKFPTGVAQGDLIVFGNTAGYLMHFRESRSHQLPLAKNLIARSESADEFSLDPIDR